MIVPGCSESGDEPNMPTFVYMLRRCGTLKICASNSNDSRPSLPKNPGCAVAPAVNGLRALAPNQARLQILKAARQEGDRLRWTGVWGPGTTLDTLGSPLTETGYSVCLYDPAAALIFAGTIPPGANWQEQRGGFAYRNRAKVPDGIAELELAVEASTRTRILLIGRGNLLRLPMLPTALPLTIQLQNTEGSCWESRFSEPERVNTPHRFKDRAD